MVGTLEDTAAERLLDQMGIEKKAYGNQVEPYKDLEFGRLDAVLLGPAHRRLLRASPIRS